VTLRFAFSLVLLILACSTPAQDGLAAAVRAADAAMFRAFNECDVAAMAAMYADDLEFFHDTGGLDDKARTLEKTRDLCARELGLERTLVEDRVEPVAGYGAIHEGRHRFCHEVDGVEDCGTFDFLHIWKREGEGWRLARVVSYGH
jgi:ketosteroid isomerase-like protein